MWFAGISSSPPPTLWALTASCWCASPGPARSPPGCAGFPMARRAVDEGLDLALVEITEQVSPGCWWASPAWILTPRQGRPTLTAAGASASPGCRKSAGTTGPSRCGSPGASMATCLPVRGWSSTWPPYGSGTRRPASPPGTCRAPRGRGSRARWSSPGFWPSAWCSSTTAVGG